MSFEQKFVVAIILFVICIFLAESIIAGDRLVKRVCSIETKLGMEHPGFCPKGEK